MISDIVLISELLGEELEYLRLRHVDTVPSLLMASREGMFLSGVSVSVVKGLLKQSIASHANNSLSPINLS